VSGCCCELRWGCRKGVWEVKRWVL
jgi:hypothetical protein